MSGLFVRQFVMQEYIKEKQKVLNDFGIKLTESEFEHIRGLTSEVAIDNYVRLLIKRRFDTEQSERRPQYIMYTGQVFGTNSILSDRRSTSVTC